MLYRWHSTYLEQYRKGQIIVMADSPEAARSIARRSFDAHDRDEHSWLYEVDDEDCRIELANHRREFEADITPEPDVIPAGCLFVSGSE